MVWEKVLSNMKVHILAARTDNYSFVLEREGHCLVVDPAEGLSVSNWLLSRRLQLEAVLITHKHNDHVDGVPDLLHAYPHAEVVAPSGAAGSLPRVDRAVREGTPYTWRGLTCLVLDTKGHTAEHVSYYWPSEKSLFSGDVLFPFGCGRIFDGTVDDQFRTLQRLKRLGTDTLVFCAHEYAHNNLEFVLEHLQDLYEPVEQVALGRILTKILNLRSQGRITVPFPLSQELTLNPFLRATDLDLFKDIRKMRDHWRGPTRAMVH